MLMMILGTDNSDAACSARQMRGSPSRPRKRQPKDAAERTGRSIENKMLTIFNNEIGQHLRFDLAI